MPPRRLFVVVTTGTSCGAVNAMHDSFMPIAGMVPLLNMQLGEVIFGGVGAGLYGMLMFAILAVFIAGPDGRAHARVPGQEDRGFEMKMAMLAVLVLAASILVFTALASVGCGAPPGPQPRAARLLRDPVRLLAATGNNGSAFAG